MSRADNVRPLLVRACSCRPAVPASRWPAIAADARLLGLRQAAKQHRVSHETVRQIVRRVAATACTCCLA